MLKDLKISGLLLAALLIMAGAPRPAQAAGVAPLVNQGWLLGGFSHRPTSKSISSLLRHFP